MFISRISDANDMKYRKLQVFNHTLDHPKQYSGQFKWNVPLNGVDYLTRTFVYDSHYCSGRGNPYNALAKGNQDLNNNKLHHPILGHTIL